jgi:hypothetical protein
LAGLETMIRRLTSRCNGLRLPRAYSGFLFQCDEGECLGPWSAATKVGVLVRLGPLFRCSR